MITEEDLQDLCRAAAVAGCGVDVGKLKIEIWEAGEAHVPKPLPPGTAAVYVFAWNGECLKGRQGEPEIKR